MAQTTRSTGRTKSRLIGRDHVKPWVINADRVAMVCRVYSGSLSAEERANERNYG